MKRFEEAIHELATVRAKKIEAALMQVYYGDNSPYSRDPRVELFRDNMPTERDMEHHTASVLANHVGVNDPHLISLVVDSYPNYGYHCLVHGVLTAIVVRRLCGIYLPYHNDMTRVAVLAALFHDSFHTHGALSDSENIMRAQRYVHNVVALHGDRLGYPKHTAQYVCNMLEITEWTAGAFPHDIPSSSIEPLGPTASCDAQLAMAMRIVAESDLMMSATPLWPALGSMIALDMSTANGNDANLDIEQFCRSQIYFIERTCLPRLRLSETRDAAIAVAAMHRTVIDMHS